MICKRPNCGRSAVYSTLVLCTRCYQRQYKRKVRRRPGGMKRHYENNRRSYLFTTYGLTEQDYQQLLDQQGGRCAICGSKPKTRRLSTDHEHRKNYKHFSPVIKKQYIRGLLCMQCNYFELWRGTSIAKKKAAILYLQKYEARREKLQHQTMALD